jgi:hypothetical protein
MLQYLAVLAPVAFVSITFLSGWVTKRQLLCIASVTALVSAFVFLFCTTVVPPNHFGVETNYGQHAGPEGLTPGRYLVLPPFRSVLAVPAESHKEIECAALTQDAATIRGKFAVLVNRNATFNAQQVEFFGADQLGVFERSLEPIVLQSWKIAVCTRRHHEITGSKERIRQQLCSAIQAELQSDLQRNGLPPSIAKVAVEPLDLDELATYCKIRLTLSFEQAPHQFVTRPFSGVDTSTSSGDFPVWLFW